MNHRRYIAYTVVRNGCSGGNLPPSGPQGRNRGTFVFVSSNAKTFVIVSGGTIQPNGLYSPRSQPLAGLDGVGSTPLHCSVYGVVPFIGTGYICHVAGFGADILWKNIAKTINCQLSTVNCQLKNFQFFILLPGRSSSPSAWFRLLPLPASEIRLFGCRPGRCRFWRGG